LWRRKLVVLQFLVVIPALVALLSLRASPEYTATARVMVTTQASAVTVVTGQNLGEKEPDDRLVATLASFVVTPEIASRVNEELSLGQRPNDLIQDVEATPDPDANVISIQAVAPDAAVAASLANGFAAQFVDWRRETQQATVQSAIDLLDRQLAETRPDSANRDDLSARRSQLAVLLALTTGNVALGEDARAPTEPSSPKPVRNTAMAVLVALVLGFGAAFLRESFDVGFPNVEAMREATTIPILAAVPELPREYAGSTRLIALDAPRDPAVESYRLLRTNLDFVNFNRDIKSILVTSPLPSQGKTTTIANLAISLLRAEKKIAVIEGDLRRPALHRYFRAPNLRGVSTIVAGTASLQDCTKSLTFGDSHVTVATPASKTKSSPASHAMVLDLVTAGPTPPNPGEIVASAQLKKIIDDMGRGRDYVLVDAPPMFAVGDAATLAGQVDGIIIVLRFKDTSAQVLQEVENFLSRVPCRTLGLVVCGTPRKGLGASYKYDVYSAEA
jgi:Mrp family chromosome partitioning ATPase